MVNSLAIIGAGRVGRIDASDAIFQWSRRAIAGRQGFYDGRGDAGGASGPADRAIAWRIAGAHRGEQEALVSRGSGDGRRSRARGRGSSHAVTRLAGDAAERSRARVAAADASGFGEF